MPSKIIYMDYHATTPVDARVLKAMQPYWTEKFGNAASRTHGFGHEAHRAVEKARAEVARLVNADAREIVFTSGATESNNLAIKGVAEAYRQKGDHIITVSTEHKSVLDPCRRLELAGYKITYLRVGSDGAVDLDELKMSIRPQTVLISVMFANNEVGVIQPVKTIARIAGENGILFHTDATQAVGKLTVDVRALGVDLLSFSAHKICGPKGVGALYVRKRGEQLRLIPLMDGGGHEMGLRSGTLNVPAIVGFGEACRIGRLEMKREVRRVAALRDRLKRGLIDGIPGCVLHGHEHKRLPNNLNISFEGVPADTLIKTLKRLAISSGSACTSTSIEPSYVLKAMGVSDALRQSSIRIGLGRFNTSRDIAMALKDFKRAVKSLRRA